MKAFVLIKTEAGKEHELKTEIEKIKGVTEAETIYGEYDIMVRLEFPENEDPHKIVTKIRNLLGIQNTITLISSAPTS